jgi:hypothetical protein
MNDNVFINNDQQPTLALSKWSCTTDNKIWGKPITWDGLLTYLRKVEYTDNKFSVGYWNLNHFEPMQLEDGTTRKTTYRRNRNCMFLTGLILDFDNDSIFQQQLSIEQAQVLFDK